MNETRPARQLGSQPTGPVRRLCRSGGAHDPDRFHPAQGWPVHSAGSTGVLRPFLLVTLYRTLYSVAGSYVTARLAPHHPMGHALLGGVIGLILSVVGAVTTWNRPDTMGAHCIQSPSLSCRCRNRGWAEKCAPCRSRHSRSYTDSNGTLGKFSSSRSERLTTLLQESADEATRLGDRTRKPSRSILTSRPPRQSDFRGNRPFGGRLDSTSRCSRSPRIHRASAS